MFSSQVSKVMAPSHWLTVSDVVYALEELN
jgi:hypothetical protein